MAACPAGFVLFCFSNLGSWPQSLLRAMVVLDVWALSVSICKEGFMYTRRLFRPGQGSTLILATVN